MENKILLSTKEFPKRYITIQRPALWKCKCSCGTNIEVSNEDIESTFGCGKCMEREGYNESHIIEMNPVAWVCTCDCGKEIILKDYILKNEDLLIRKCGKCERCTSKMKNRGKYIIEQEKNKIREWYNNLE